MLRFAGVVSSAGHLNECLCRSAIERKNTAFSCGSSYCAAGNHSGPGHWPVRRMSCFYRCFYIPMFPVGQGCKGGCPSQALYKYSGRNGKRSRNPYRNRVFPFCKQQDISIYNVNALNRIPSKPCGTPLGIWESHRNRPGWNPGWIWVFHFWNWDRWMDGFSKLCRADR